LVQAAIAIACLIITLESKFLFTIQIERKGWGREREKRRGGKERRREEGRGGRGGEKESRSY
jgi:hypothetical protein